MTPTFKFFQGVKVEIVMQGAESAPNRVNPKIPGTILPLIVSWGGALCAKNLFLDL